MADDTRTLDVLVASYGNVDDADVDLRAVRDIHRKFGAARHLDAAVVSTSEKGRVRIEKTYEEIRRLRSPQGPWLWSVRRSRGCGISRGRDRRGDWCGCRWRRSARSSGTFRQGFPATTSGK